MIRVQVYCDVCRSSLDCVTRPEKLELAVAVVKDLHGPLCYMEVEGGQDQAEPRPAEGAAGAVEEGSAAATARAH